MTQRTRLILAVAAIAAVVLAAAILAVALARCRVQPTPEPSPIPSPTLTPTPSSSPALAPTIYSPTPAPTPTPTPTPDPYLYLESPWLSSVVKPFDRMDPEIQEEVLRELLDDPEVGPMVEDWVEAGYGVQGEIVNPVFKRVFPGSRMLWLALSEGRLGFESYTWVWFRGEGYGMPRSFNRLMFDAGYELNDETQIDLMHALIIAALPPQVASQSVVCDEGKDIYYKSGAMPASVYEIHCQAGVYEPNEGEGIHVGVDKGYYEDIDDIVVTFEEFDDQFRCLSPGGVDESGGLLFGGIECVNEWPEEE